METLPDQFEHRPDCAGAEIDTHCLGCAIVEQNRADATAEMLRRMLFDFGDFDTDEDRLAEFRRLRKEARKMVQNAALTGRGDGE